MKSFHDNIDTVFFDVDSTLVAIEGIDFLAKECGCFDEVAAMTEEAMSGNISISDVYAKRLNLIRPSKDDLKVLCQAYEAKLLPEAKACIQALQYLNKTVYLISGGLDPAVQSLGKFLEVDGAWGVPVFFNEDGFYQGFDETCSLCQDRGKRKYVEKLGKHAQASAFIGDGMTDLQVKDLVDVFVAFLGIRKHEALAQASEHVVREANLAQVLPSILNEKELETLRDSPFSQLLSD